METYQTVNFALSKKAVTKHAISMIELNDPAMYSFILSSDKNKHAFDTFCLRFMRNLIRNEPSPQVTDEKTALKRYFNLLRSSIYSVSSTFKNLASRTKPVSTNPENICPICLESSCNFALECCGGAIHQECWLEAAAQTPKCPLCRFNYST